jgi:hypothetical protein
MDAYETWAYSWKGKTFSHKGVKYVIEEQLSEEENIVLAQRLVLTVARQLNSGRQFLLKIKYEYVLFPPPALSLSLGLY